MSQPRAASARVRWAFSLVVGLHFAAILAAVTGPGGGGSFQSPYWGVTANRFFAPYLETLNFQSPYRFYAPDPGCDPAIWFRVTYRDRSVRWVEIPNLDSTWERIAHHRTMSLAAAATEIISTPDGDGEQLTPMSQICLASYVRHLSRAHPKADREGRTLSVESVRVYSVHHRSLTPAEARDGWGFHDLRLHWAYDLGEYGPDGARRGATDRVTPAYMPDLASQILRDAPEAAEEWLPEIELAEHGNAAATRP